MQAMGPGVAKITVTKDRPGFVRQAAVGGTRAGELHLESLESGAVHAELRPVEGTGMTLSPAKRRVLEALRTGPNLSVGQIQEHTAHDDSRTLSRLGPYRRP
jgi:hypothetical protein